MSYSKAGWKSIFPVGGHVRYINGVTQEESDHLLQWFLDLVYKNHDLQVRLKWQNKNDIGSLPSCATCITDHELTTVL